MSSLRDQLLKAGLVTEEQVKKSETKPIKKQPKKATHTTKNTPVNGAAKQRTKPKKEVSELEQFYRERAKAENQERQQAEKEKQAAQQLKKERNAKITKLVSDNTLNEADPSERYNFVVGTSVKYTYVSESQLEKLANGELALTFAKGKCQVVAAEIAQQIKAIDPKRLVILQEPEEKVDNEAVEK